MGLREMRVGDRIFLSWFVIVIVGTLVLTLSNDASLDYIAERGVAGVIGEIFGSSVLFLVLIPYGIYRLNRKKKLKEVKKE